MVIVYPKGDTYSEAALLLLYLWQEFSNEEHVALHNVSLLESWRY